MTWRFTELGWRFFGSRFKPRKESPVSDEQNQPTPEEQLDRAAEHAKGPAAPKGPPSLHKVSMPARVGPANVARAINPTSFAPAAKQVVVDDAFGHTTAFKFAFVGSGQGGGRIANSFYKLGYRRVAVMNTTDMDFAGIEAAVPRLNLAVGGAAKDADFAARQLKGREEEVWDLFSKAWGNDAEYALVCVGLGGGTGSGTCAQLVETARKYLASKGKAPKVGAVVSLPPVAEGQQVSRNAINAFNALLALKVSPLFIIDNARIHELYRPGMTALHRTANETFTQLFHVFDHYASVHSELVTFDQSEYAQLLDGGVVVMGAADIAADQITTPADISTRIRENLATNVLAPCDLAKGKKAALLFVGEQELMDNLSMDYFDAGFTQLNRTVGSAAKDKDKEPAVIHRGVYVGADPGLQCYTMVSELEPPVDRLAGMAKEARIDRLSNAKGMAAFLGVQD